MVQDMTFVQPMQQILSLQIFVVKKKQIFEKTKPEGSTGVLDGLVWDFSGEGVGGPHVKPCS